MLKCDDLQKRAGQSNLWFALSTREPEENPIDAKYKSGSFEDLESVYLISAPEKAYQSGDYFLNLLKESNFIEVKLDDEKECKYFIENHEQRNKIGSIYGGIWRLTIEGHKRISELRDKNNFLKQLSTLQLSNWLSVIIGLAALFLAIPAIQRFFHIN